MTAKLVHAAATPLERPTTPSMFAVIGVASNCASKAPVCEVTALFCQAPALVTQLGTVIAAVPLLPSHVAVIVAVPRASPVTRPVADTLASAGALEAQVTVRPLSGLPSESFGVAVSCSVAPTATRAVAGLTVTVATGAGGGGGGGVQGARATLQTVSLPMSA